MRFSTFILQNAEITTCKVMIQQWWQPTWFMITICSNIINIYSHSSLCYQGLKENTLNIWKCLGIKAWTKTSCPHLCTSIREETWKWSGIFLSSIFNMAKYSVFKQISTSTAVLIGLTPFPLHADSLATSLLFFSLDF